MEKEKNIKDENEMKSVSFKYHFENLVVEGGGGRIVAIGGTLIELENRGILQNIKNYSGTSAGAIVATTLCLGYTGSEIADLLMKTDFNKFLDDSFGISMDLYRLYNEYGFYKGDAFLNFARKIIADKTFDIRNGDITFQELYQTNEKELVLVATNLTKDKIEYLSRHTYPDMPVALAVRASMSIPLVYKPVIYKENVFCDGGLGMNFPIQTFDGDFPKDVDNLYTDINTKTLGLKFMAKDEKRNNRIYANPTPIKNLFSYSTAVLTHMLNRMERTSVKTGYWERSITVPTGVIGTLEFNLTDDQKRNAQKTAQQVAIEELDYFDTYQRFPTSPKIESNI